VEQATVAALAGLLNLNTRQFAAAKKSATDCNLPLLDYLDAELRRQATPRHEGA
jgi:hypothetical protein